MVAFCATSWVKQKQLDSSPSRPQVNIPWDELTRTPLGLGVYLEPGHFKEDYPLTIFCFRRNVDVVIG